MNKLFIDNLVERLENNIDIVNVNTQREIRDYLILDGEKYLYFPMLSFEHTNDSNIEVDITESKFFNDDSHKGTWISGGAEYSLDFIINLKDYDGILEIDAFEVNEQSRGEGLGGNLLSIIESIAEDYYDKIIVSPFDTDAMNFWNHMGYKESKNGYWIKELYEYKKY